jgi:preflagellin peptidase FlaK
MPDLASITSVLNSFPITPDTLRFLAVFAFIYGAILDHRSRRVYNEFWIPLIGLTFIVLGWDIALILVAPGPVRSEFLYSLSLSFLIVPSIAFTLWQVGFFGGADLKALAFLAFFFPQPPSITIAGTTYPAIEGATPIFTFTILFNAFVFATGYQLYVVARNISNGDFSSRMTNSTRYLTSKIDEKHGTLVERTSGFFNSGVDLDAIRMYLQWRGLGLDDIRSAPGFYRSTPPATENRVGDGSVETTGSTPLGHSRAEFQSSRSDREEGLVPAGPVQPEYPDEWGAEKFVDAVDTEEKTVLVTAEELREALDTITSKKKVWVMPAMPFFIPLTLGLIVSFIYGSLLKAFSQGLAALIFEAFIS